MSGEIASPDDGLAEDAARPTFGNWPLAGEPNPVVHLGPHRRPVLQADGPGPVDGHESGPAIRVLVVDGDTDDFLIVRDLLARAEEGQFVVAHAPEPESGLGQLLAGQHDIGLVDYRLADGDGLSFTRLAARRGVRVPLILVSGVAIPDLEVEAIESGAADFLDKEEYDVERLARAIRVALARRRRSTLVERPAPADSLTGLPSRALYADRLDRALARAHRDRKLAAIMVLDLDRFDGVNRRFGHGTGDTLLRLVGARLLRQVREVDTVARFEADRFALIIESLARPEHAGLVAQKLLAAVAAPIAIGGETLAVTASAGAAIFPADATVADGLLALAEAAVHQAKAQGGNCCRLHDERLDGSVRGDAANAARLRRAIETDALAVHFQPQVTLCSAELGLAALVRWRHETLGVIDGERIRSLAETTALVEPLTDWLLAAACRQAARWRAAGLPRLHVAVPLLSRRQLAWSGLARRVEAHLHDAGIPPDWLELELDEQLLLDDLQGKGQALGPVRELGVRLAVGGFGNGPTSLSVLRDTPLSTVKLSRAMLHGIPEDQHRTLFAGTVVTLARQLRLRLVAEGVESQAQLQLLKAQGCDAVQCFISCPPLPADACTDWLRQAARRA